ncbi:hypothetical protein ACIF83_15115 [Streptomyces sp. NPDC085866]|uniref:hypothetical protein n=1 Tax=unclassified Streptomyces TaxID=2593676 RepID=UPI00378A70EE
MNRTVHRAVTVIATLFALLGIGAAAASADEQAPPAAVVSGVTGVHLPVDPSDSMVWD